MSEEKYMDLTGNCARIAGSRTGRTVPKWKLSPITSSFWAAAVLREAAVLSAAEVPPVEAVLPLEGVIIPMPSNRAKTAMPRQMTVLPMIFHFN